MNPVKPTNPATNPAVAELQALRSELSLVREELIGLRTELKTRKPTDITDQVAKGVVIASIFMAVCWAALAFFFSLVGMLR